MTERTHHNASPSALKRISLCPGSLALSKKAPREVENKYAIEGQMLHDRVLPDSDLQGLSEEQTTLINRCRVCLSKYTEEMATDGQEVLYEQKLQLPAIFGEDMFGNPMKGKGSISYGYGDVIIVRPKLVSILDWKFGRGPVDPPGQNLQMLAYGVMSALRWQKSHAQIVVYQPRIFKVAQYYDLKGQDLTNTWKHIAQIIDKANEPDAPLHPSEEACKYCPALTICTAVEDSALAIRNAGEIKDIKDPATLAMLLTQARVVKKRCEEVEAQAKAIAEEHQNQLRDKDGNVIYERKKIAGGATVLADANAVYERILAHFRPSLSLEKRLEYFLKHHVQVKQPAELRNTFAKDHKAQTGETLEEGRKFFEDLMSGDPDPAKNIPNLITKQADKMRLELKKETE